jgi:hypothetical protein
LQTAQCAFSPAAVTAYLSICYVQAAQILSDYRDDYSPAVCRGWMVVLSAHPKHRRSVGHQRYPDCSWLQRVAWSQHGQWVIVAGVAGNTAAIGDQTITVVEATHISLNGTTGNGAYTGGGTVSGGGMAYYDAWAVAQANSVLHRALADFEHQDDDPTVNANADSSTLADWVGIHIETIRTAVLIAVPGTRFHMLWPYDVNRPTCYTGPDLPYPQGGRLNYAVNLHSTWLAPVTSGFNAVMVECLSAGDFYRNFDIAREAIGFMSTTGSWSKGSVIYLCPWLNGGCDWEREYLYCLGNGFSAVLMWALDHGKDKIQAMPS